MSRRGESVPYVSYATRTGCSSRPQSSRTGSAGRGTASRPCRPSRPRRVARLSSRRHMARVISLVCGPVYCRSIPIGKIPYPENGTRGRDDHGRQRSQRPGTARRARGAEGRARGRPVHLAGVRPSGRTACTARSTIQSFFGLGEEQSHKTETVFDADHPEIFAADGQRHHADRVPPRRPGELPDGRRGVRRAEPRHPAALGRVDGRRRSTTSAASSAPTATSATASTTSR